MCFPSPPLDFKLPPFQADCCWLLPVRVNVLADWTALRTGWMMWVGGGGKTRRVGWGRRVRGVRMSVIAMQWEVVLKIPIDTWAPAHKQGHRQTHKAVTKQVLFMHHQAEKQCRNIRIFIRPSNMHTQAPYETQSRPFPHSSYKPGEQTNPAAILWPSAGGIWESCSVHIVLSARCGKQAYCFCVYLTLTYCWMCLPNVDHLKKRDANSLVFYYIITKYGCVSISTEVLLVKCI